MRVIQEIGFSLMLIIGLSMIVCDVLLGRSREMEAKNVFRKNQAR